MYSSVRLTWAMCCMFFMLASTLTMMSMAGFTFPHSIWAPVSGLLICAIFSIECTRQAHVNLNRWSIRSIYLWAPFSLFSFLLPSILTIKIAIAFISLIFWILALFSAQKLLTVSAKNYTQCREAKIHD